MDRNILNYYERGIWDLNIEYFLKTSTIYRMIQFNVMETDFNIFLNFLNRLPIILINPELIRQIQETLICIYNMQIRLKCEFKKLVLPRGKYWKLYSLFFFFIQLVYDSISVSFLWIIVIVKWQILNQISSSLVN